MPTLDSSDSSDSGDAAVCGDGVVDDDEECDDGEDNRSDASCTPECTTNVCGDLYVHVTEECDDGNAIDTDECTSSCTAAACGDGYVYAGVEECDDDAATGDGASSCTPGCIANTCGDGYRHTSTEECDPGGPSVSCEADCTSITVPVVSISAAFQISCAVFEPGAARCWVGYTPALDIPDLDLGGAVVQLSASDTHVCSLLSDGGVRCFGYGTYGQLGYGNTDQISLETPAIAGSVDVGDEVVQVATGSWHSCALTMGGEVRCWGRGEFGALGYANTQNIGDDEMPASVGSVDVGGTVVQIDARGGHTCALLDTGAVRCWGGNAHGQLGYANTDTIGDDEAPASVGDIDIGAPAVQIALGYTHTCALLEGGAVRCWGSGGSGQLGYANTDDIGDDEAPADAGDVDVGGTAVRIDAGAHTCAILDTNALRCWGSSSYTGQLGYGDYIACSFGMCDFQNVGDDETPASVGDVPIAGDLGVQAVAVGLEHTCAVLAGGVVRCWGHPSGLGYGGLGGKFFADEDVPL